MKPRVATKIHTKVETGDILAFFQQLATLFRAGTPIHEALLIATEQSQSSTLQQVIGDVANAVSAGSPMYVSLAKYEEHFKVEWIEIVRSGEESGLLGEVLDRLTQQIDTAHKLRQKIVSSLMYPMICAIVAVIAISVMLVKVVPTFAGMFEAMDQELPAITQSVIGASDFLAENGLVILAGIAVGVYVLRRYVHTDEGKAQKDNLMVCLPMVGDVTVQASMQKYASNIAMLLRAGMPLLDAINSLKGIFRNNTVYEGALARVVQYVERGGGLADGLEQTSVFTAFAVSMTRIGEQSGTLAECLDEVEQFYRRKIEVLVERLTGTMETIVILAMGVTVAVILCAVYLPMFSMASGVG